jgi:hypothetical protein
MKSLLKQVVSLTDHTRLAAGNSKPSGWYKEWFHFCVVGPQISAVINFSYLGDNRSGIPEGQFQPRVILLVHTGDWDGEVIAIPPEDVQIDPGKINLQFGHNYLVFEKGLFRLSIALETRPITVDLKIEPITFPLYRSRATIGSGAIDWLVVPRLNASGTIICQQQFYQLQNVPAYHDHNWGHWLWGQDFSWTWGFSLPADRSRVWSLVYSAMTNRARNQNHEHKLCIWKDDRLERIFALRDIQVRQKGYFKKRDIPKFPPIMKLLKPETTSDVPDFLDIQAEKGKDHLSCHFDIEDVAQIIIPNEVNLESTIINEVIGNIKVSGSVKQEEIEFEGKGFFEFLT